jgi:DNA-binding CsgD family transcriptional regulator
MVEDGRQVNPVLSHMVDRWSEQTRGDVLTLRGLDVGSGLAWRESRYFAEHLRPEGYGDFLGTTMSHGLRDHCTGFALVRARSDRPFSTDERDLLHVFHLECGRLLTRRMALPETGALLTRRQLETFDLLLTGAADKDIADRLGISYHTARQYVKVVYRAWGVRSRTELMLKSRRGARPR